MFAYLLFIQYTVTFIQYVTGFAKKGLPHTSSFIYELGDCNLGLKVHKNLKFCPPVSQCWYSLLSNFQGYGGFWSEVTNCQLNVCKTPFYKSSHI